VGVLAVDGPIPLREVRYEYPDGTSVHRNRR
jgi:hypothetical protein